jgi:type IV pilus assembly protein PilM
VGLCALKALRLELIDGQVTATAFDYVEHPKILSQPDADPDALTREALEKFLTRNTLKGDQVAISVPGQSGLARFVKLPPVEEKKITDIVRFEAKQQIPFPLDEVVWDYQKIGSGTVTNGFAMETEIGLFAMKRDMVNRAMQPFKDVGIEVHLVQMAPLALCNFVAYDLLGKGVAPPAPEGAEGEEEAAAADGDSKNKCVVALDLGTDSSNLVVSDGERIIWQRPIPLGGNHFTRALTKELKLTFAKAEHLKRNATKSPDLKKILSALKPVLNDFVGEAQRSLGYFTNTHRDANIQYMMGLGSAFRLPGMQKFLSEKLQLDVKKLQKLERLTGDTVINAPAFTQNVLSFAVAYGLALQGLGLTKLQTNLLPPEIQLDRLVRAKKPWAVAAAAALLVAVPSLAVGYALQLRAVDAESVQEAKKAGAAVVKKKDDADKAFKAKLTEVEKNEEAVKMIIAGQEERLNWVLLNRFVNECLPVPATRVTGKFDGPTPGKKDEVTVIDRDGNRFSVPLQGASYQQGQPSTIGGVILVDGKPALLADQLPRLKKGDEVTVLYQAAEGARAYWNQQALEAYLSNFDRLTAAKEGESKEDQGVEHLIQMNIEAVDARYGELKPMFEHLKREEDKRGGVTWATESEKNTPPEGKGWLVELRGYTYHGKGRPLVKEALLQNLATKGKKMTVPGEAPADATPPADAKAAPGKAESGGAKGGTPAKPGPAPEAKDPAKDKAREMAEAWNKIIDGKVSHVVLCRYREVPNPEFGKFVIVDRSELDALTSGSSGGGGGTAAGGATGLPSGGGGGGDGGAGKAWQPLIKGSTSGGSSGSPGGGGMPGGGGAPGGMSGMDSMAKSGPGANKPGTSGDESKGPKRGPSRTEFVVLFFWKEPTPSDDRLAGKEKDTGASKSKGGGGMGFPGMSGAGGAGGGTPTGSGSGDSGSDEKEKSGKGLRGKLEGID